MRVSFIVAIVLSCVLSVSAAPLPGLVSGINIRDVNPGVTEGGATHVTPAAERPGDMAGVRRAGIVGEVVGDVVAVEGTVVGAEGEIITEVEDLICKDERDWSMPKPGTTCNIENLTRYQDHCKMDRNAKTAEQMSSCLQAHGCPDTSSVGRSGL